MRARMTWSLSSPTARKKESKNQRAADVTTKCPLSLAPIEPLAGWKRGAGRCAVSACSTAGAGGVPFRREEMAGTKSARIDAIPLWARPQEALPPGELSQRQTAPNKRTNSRQKRDSRRCHVRRGTERGGFEPPDPCGSHDFESCRFNRAHAPLRACRRYNRVGCRPQARSTASKAQLHGALQGAALRRDRLLAAGGEEFLQEVAGFVGADAGGDIDVMVEAWVV